MLMYQERIRAAPLIMTAKQLNSMSGTPATSRAPLHLREGAPNHQPAGDWLREETNNSFRGLTMR
jgi:hypothetical protein